MRFVKRQVMPATIRRVVGVELAALIVKYEEWIAEGEQRLAGREAKDREWARDIAMAHAASKQAKLEAFKSSR